MKVRALLLLYFPNLEIVPLEDDGTTGNFEIFDNMNNTIHSKRNNRQGRCETIQEQELLIAKVAKLMNVPIPEVDQEKLKKIREPQGSQTLLTHSFIRSLVTFQGVCVIM